MSEREFDNAVAVAREAGVKPRHKPYGKNKLNCTPEQWAAHLEWKSQRHRDPEVKAMHEVYRNRSLARKI